MPTVRIPQQPVLSPLLFSHYLTSLGDFISSQEFNYNLYTDDSWLYIFNPGFSAELIICLQLDLGYLGLFHRYLKHNKPKTQSILLLPSPPFKFPYYC